MNSLHHQESWLRTGLRNQVLRTGVLTGGLLILVMFVALLLANRAPLLERFAWLRNDIFWLVFGLVLLCPIFRYFRSPGRLFASGLLAWLLFSIAYDLANDYLFFNLSNRLNKTPFQVFFLGAVSYGVAAVLAWVGRMLASTLRHPVAPRRRRPDHATHLR